MAGFDLKVDEGLLRNYARFATDRLETHVQRKTAIDWAAQAPSPSQRERRLGMVRRFAEHVRAEDSGHECVPQHVFAHKRRRSSPTILSPEQLQQLLDATARLRPKGSLRPYTYYTLFGLLAATGLRISEALQRYLEQRKAAGGDDNHVFISTTGGALSYAMVNGTFHFLIASIDFAAKPDRRPPRIHGLRHYFAMQALESCNGGRDAVASHMMALSTYLGHAHVTDTYWYLQATSHLMHGVADACEHCDDGGAP